jgi:hypothetical protein
MANAAEILVPLPSARESGDAVGLIPTVRRKHPIDLVDHTLTTELTFNNMNYRKAVATLRPTDQLLMSYHSYCYELSKQFTPVHLHVKILYQMRLLNNNGQMDVWANIIDNISQFINPNWDGRLK